MKYRRLLLFDNTQNEYFTSSGITVGFDDQRHSVKNFSYIEFAEGKTTDVPYQVLTCIGEKLIEGKEHFVLPLIQGAEACSCSSRTYKAGLERALWFVCTHYVYLRIEREPDVQHYHPGYYAKVVPRVKVNGTVQTKDPFYVCGNGILDKDFNYLLGVFLRVKKTSGSYHIEKCVVKIKESVFLCPQEPLHKIILKDILPELIGATFTVQSRLLTLFREERIDVPVMIEIDKTEGIIQRAMEINPDVSASDISNRATHYAKTTNMVRIRE